MEQSILSKCPVPYLIISTSVRKINQSILHITHTHTQSLYITHHIRLSYSNLNLMDTNMIKRVMLPRRPSARKEAANLKRLLPTRN